MRSVASRQVFELDLVDQEASFAMGALLCTDESNLQVRLPRSTIHAYYLLFYQDRLVLRGGCGECSRF
jgi:hypothetical protein